VADPLVLVVDDDPDILEAVAEILEGEGYRVARARNGLEALERVEEELPALVLLDLMMPLMDGAAFGRELEARRPSLRLPIVVISADGNPDRAVVPGTVGILPKPFDIDSLLHLVAEKAGPPSRGDSRESPGETQA
jgi:CheY-like chemotaxis protein